MRQSDTVSTLSGKKENENSQGHLKDAGKKSRKKGARTRPHVENSGNHRILDAKFPSVTLAERNGQRGPSGTCPHGKEKTKRRNRKIRTRRRRHGTKSKWKTEIVIAGRRRGIESKGDFERTSALFGRPRQGAESIFAGSEGFSN